MAVVTQERTWNNVPVRIVTDTSTGETKVSYKSVNPIFGTSSYVLIASSSSNKWTTTNELGRAFRTYNPNSRSLSDPQIEDIFQRRGRNIFDNDRASVLNTRANYATQEQFENNRIAFYESGIPKIKDPRSGLTTNSNGLPQTSVTRVSSGPVLSNRVGGDEVAVRPSGEEDNGRSAAPPLPKGSPVDDLDVVGILKNMEDVLQAQLKEYDDALVKPKVYRYPLANLEVASEIGINFDFLRIRTVDHVSSLSAADVSGLGGLNADSTIANAQDTLFGGVNISQVYLQNQRVKEYIILPMQPNISSSNAVDWGSDSMNIAKLIGGQMLNNYFNNTAQKGFVDAFKELLTSVIQQGGNLADMAVSNKSSIAALLAGSLVNGNLLQRATGTVINPNMEMLFNGPRLRTFNFQFDFTPRFKKEAEEVRAIIATLKYRMAPRRTEGNAFLRSPHIFLLDYIYNGGGSPDEFTKGLRSDEELKPFTMNPHPYLNKIKPCALVDFNVNYTPDGSYMTYKDGGSMTRYSINMSFAEIEPIYANDYETTTSVGKYTGIERPGFNANEMGY